MQSIGIGELNMFDSAGEMRRALLYFDRLALVGVDKESAPARFFDSETRSLWDSELKKLKDAGLIFDPLSKLCQPPPHWRSNKSYGLTLKSLKDEEEARQSFESLLSPPDSTGWRSLRDQSDSDEAICHFDNMMFKGWHVSHYRAIHIAGLLQVMEGAQCASMIPVPPLASDMDGEERLPRAIHCAIHSIPVPRDDMSWEEIQQLREDKDLRRRLLALRLWTRDVAKGDSSAHEMTEKLEWLIAEYEYSLKLHRVALVRGTVETLVTTTAEVLDSLVRLKFADAAKAIFALTSRHGELARLERESVGYEISYVPTLKQKIHCEK